VDGAEIVLLAVSTSQTPALLLEAAAAAPEALFTDAASLKRSVAAAAAALPGATCFVGGHPMAGSRTAGIAGARADLFRDRPWLVVPTDRSDVRSIAAVQDLVRGIGARPAVVDAERHDLGKPPPARRRLGPRAGGFRRSRKRRGKGCRTGPPRRDAHR
jgi:prephenate dehydrogenase